MDMDEVEKMDETSGSLVKHVISPQCSARLSAVTVWYVIENRACASMCSNRSLLQQAAENIWVHLYGHFHV